MTIDAKPAAATAAFRGAMLAALLLTLLAPLAAQNGRPRPKSAPPAGKLQRLLHQLHKIGPAEWQAHVDKLAREQRALQRQAKQLRARAGQLDARARARGAEIERLRKLRALLPSLVKSPAARTATAKAKTKPTAKPSVAKKAMAAKKRARKPATKKPVAKKPATKKPITKKPTEVLITFSDDIAPIFENRCVVCHDAGEPSGGLDLSSYTGTTRGGSSGRTLKAFDPEASRLWQLVSHQEKPTMPPDSPAIPAAERTKIQTWIRQGLARDRAAALRLQKQRAAKAAKKRRVVKGAPKKKPMRRLALPKAGLLAKVLMPRHAASIKSLARSPAADLVALPGHRQVVLMQASNSRVLGGLPFPGTVEVLRFSANGRRLLAAGGIAGRTGIVRLFDMEKYRKARDFGSFPDAVLAADLSGDGRRIAVGGSNRRVSIFDARTGKRRHRIGGHKDWVLSVRFTPDGKLLASGDRAGTILVTATANGRNQHELRAHTGSVLGLCFDTGSKRLASVGNDGTLQIHRLSDGRRTARRGTGTKRLLSVVWGRDDILMTTGADGVVRAFRGNSQPLLTTTSVGEWLYAAVVPERNIILAGGHSGSIHRIDARRRRAVARVWPPQAKQRPKVRKAPD